MRARGCLLMFIAVLSAPTLPAAAAAPAPAAVTPYHRVPERSRMTSAQKKAETFVAKLFARARSATAANDFGTALTAYEDALKVLEEAYGADEPRLTEALHGIVATRVSWDNYSAQYGFGMRGGLGAAVEAQERIVSIYEGRSDIDPSERVAALVDLGDVYLYTNDKRALDTYRRAWQLQADLTSPEEADAAFNGIAVVRLVLPENPVGHPDWEVTVTYDVDAQGQVSVSRVTGNAPASILDGIRTDYGHARFRPRIAGGAPVDTHDISYTHKYAGSATAKPQRSGS